MNQQHINDLQTSYDKIAEKYVVHIYNELKDKPLDCELLDKFVERVKDKGLVCDVGCGPGHVARYLFERGVNVCGIDLSQGMIEQARLLNPEINFHQGNMMSLDVSNESFAGITAFYSIIHIPRQEVVDALLELRRVLKPKGVLFLAFHIGEEILHLEELWEEKINADFILFQTDEMKNYLTKAEFEIIEAIEREPYKDVEHQSRRAYIFAKK
jgi:ubiquinone/menaquinone biosynthesis C-methylase UbiE